MSGGGLVSSLRSGTTLTELAERLKQAEAHLSSLTDDTAFIKGNLDVLRELDDLLREVHACVTIHLGHAAAPERVQQFKQNPTIFGASPLQPWASFLNELRGDRVRLLKFLQVRIPILVVDSAGAIQASSLPREQLQLNDPFDTAPIASFEPHTVKALATFLSEMEVAQSPGDSFEVQFEDES
jgi:hypothetical protein